MNVFDNSILDDVSTLEKPEPKGANTMNAYYEYFNRLAKLPTDMTQSRKKELSRLFKDITQYYVESDLHVNGQYAKEDMIAFVQAEGNVKKALEFSAHGMSFWDCENVDWDKVFSMSGGWPNLTVRGKHASESYPEDYFDPEEKKYKEPDFAY